jgi:hypothetical protein
MILSLLLPRIGSQIQRGTIHKLIAKTGDELRPGTPLLELRVDLGSDKMQDCPPVIFFRIIATERAYLRRFDVMLGAVHDVGSLLGITTSTRDESAEGMPARATRTTSVAIQIDPLTR